MNLQTLREEVYESNLALVRNGLVISTFGNASGYDPELGLVVIKPSGVAYDRLTPEQLVVTDLDGKSIDSNLRPSSDLPTHLLLYKSFPGIRGVAHTHSRYATAWAQAGRDIPCLGTTHADYFRGPVPVTEHMPVDEIEGEYEHNTGLAIVRRFEKLNPLQVPAVLVVGHAPFAWGSTPHDAAHHAMLVEEVAHLAFLTFAVNQAAAALPTILSERHFLRKHGTHAYYGQPAKTVNR